MSNAIRYDSLLVRYLAIELNERLAERRLLAAQLDRDARRLVLDFGTEGLVWELHPARGELRFTSPPGLAAGDNGPPGALRLPRKAAIRRVHAPLDERVVVFELAGSGKPAGRARRIVVELITNQWNALAVDAAGRILKVMRAQKGAARALHTGAVYEVPSPTGRAGTDQPISLDAWRELLETTPVEDRATTVVAAVAWTSTFNVGAILDPHSKAAGSAGEDPVAGSSPNNVAWGEVPGIPRHGGVRREIEAAYARYTAIASLPPSSPCLIETDWGVQPYPFPLPGRTARPAASLIEAIAAAASPSAKDGGRAQAGGTGGVAERAGVAVPDGPLPAAAAVAVLGRRLGRLDKRIARLRAELDGAAAEATSLRKRADLLLSQLDSVRKGATDVVLSDFAGGTVTVALDPALEPAENARRIYDAAKKRERAARRLPPLIEAAEHERAQLIRLRARAEAGEATSAELESMAEPVRPAAGPAKQAVTVQPYRRYRTSGGLEVRVGRGSRSNDALTFHHSSPDDVWMHARDAAGAHVILRWTDAAANPPARDVHEAAVLAALNSRARTSGTVAVDWTRRKYVRKPRKAPPGVVLVERVKTVFVEPDVAIEERMRLL